MKLITVLVDLGLTLCQAKVYLTLCRHGELDVKTISKLSSVPRQDIYRVVKGLEGQGLVEREITRPTKFIGLSIEKGIEILLKRRKTAIHRLESNINNAIADFHKKQIQKQPHESGFVFIPKREFVMERIRSAIVEAEKSIDVMLSWQRYRYGMSELWDAFDEALGKRVYVRFILETPPKKEIKRVAEIFEKYQIFEVRFLQTMPKTVFGIYDKKAIFIVTEPEKGLPDSPALWTNNHSLIEAMQDYYDILWMTSPPEPQITTDELINRI